MSDTATPAKTQTTTYVVLRKEARPDTGTVVWSVENGNVPATSGEGAIRLAIKADEKAKGTFVAIPARSWKPVQVTAKVETTLELKPAS